MATIMYGKRSLYNLLRQSSAVTIAELKEALDKELFTQTEGESSTGGGGLTIIAEDGEMSGTYDGSVLALGSATITGSLVVNGNLNCVGSLYNADGHSVFILGDLTADRIRFSPEEDGITQNDLEVKGNLRCRRLDYRPNPEQSPTVRVGGNMVCEDTLRGEGNVGANGLTVRVSGSFDAEYVELGGGEAGEFSNAGRGGYLRVMGNATANDGMDFQGGGSSEAGRDAGNGGSIYVFGSLTGYFYGAGGDSYGGGNGGNGGQIQVQGTFANLWTNLSGGDCSASASSFRAGNGGSVYAGQIIGDSPISVSGGDRSGDLDDANNVVSGPNAGTIEARGDICASDLNLQGGVVSASFSGVANCPGGTGGYLSCRGNLVAYSVNLNGGQSTGQVGGNGGIMDIRGRTDIELSLELSGGASSTVNGSAGSATLRSGSTVLYATLLDGGGEATIPTQACGLYLGGPVTIRVLDQTDRAESYIRGLSSYGNRVTLSVGGMTNKKTLTQPNNELTGDISESIVASTFTYDLVFGWYRHQGTSID